MKATVPVSEVILLFLCRLCALLAITLLPTILTLVAYSGAPVLSLHFLTSLWQQNAITQGGILAPIIGTVMIGIGVMIVSFPLGVATAVFLTEYSSHSGWQRIIQLAIRNLAGVPSVVYGLFGLAVFAQALHLGSTLLSAVLTLSIMTLPWIISASVEALETVPVAFRESSLALGATPGQTVWRIVLPSALPGCITGGILGVARALGETAPIILVGAAFYLSSFSPGLLSPFMALPYHTFILATQHASPAAPAFAAGTALTLIVLTFLLSLGAIMIRYRFRVQKDW